MVCIWPKSFSQARFPVKSRQKRPPEPKYTFPGNLPTALQDQKSFQAYCQCYHFVGFYFKPDGVAFCNRFFSSFQGQFNDIDP